MDDASFRKNIAIMCNKKSGNMFDDMHIIKLRQLITG